MKDAHQSSGARNHQRTALGRISLLVGALAMAVGLVGCGTISGLKTADGKGRMDLTPYNKVLVQNFEDKASHQKNGSEQELQQSEMKGITGAFADLIAVEIKKTGVFADVSREGVEDASTLLIGGAITRFERGSSTARLWVGMGAGSSYLDALVEVRQGGTGTLLGTVQVNKNSWVLGGAIAASQTPDGFMEEAARKVAEELQNAKKQAVAQKM